ncbi:PDGLE domain-containing protein [Thermomonospora umbrina]|uniref:Cobalt/nickel transport protein n=1 Tax=Thermomonospora umbrina TaxID=111806 RepID=A0A3D9SID2_9ACTN|nr:PDGLE domain-containing protein [Thermomonospora umbrina]REE95688.1 cobalt/nickel transport protein [Thermomonospora umbrina]
MNRNGRFLLAFLLVALVVAGVVSFYASGDPDGLTKVAEDKGFIEQEKDHALKDSPLGDYAVSGVDDERLSGGLAGVVGVGITAVVGGGLFWAVRRRGGAQGGARDQRG